MATAQVHAQRIPALVHLWLVHTMEGKCTLSATASCAWWFFFINIILTTNRPFCCSTCCSTCSSCTTTQVATIDVWFTFSTCSTDNEAARETPLLHDHLLRLFVRLYYHITSFFELNLTTSLSSCNCSCCSQVSHLYCTVSCPICYHVDLDVRYETTTGAVENTTYTQKFKHNNNSASAFFTQHLVNSTSPCHYNPHDLSQVRPLLLWAISLMSMHYMFVRSFSM